jgi:hypothetical protein
VFLKPNPHTDGGSQFDHARDCRLPVSLKYLPKMQFDEKDPRKMADHKHDHPVVAFAYLAMSYPITTAARVEEARPPWWNDFFIAGTNIPKAQKTLTRRRR